jgi:4'-phosphopantetheinyl transferase
LSEQDGGLRFNVSHSRVIGLIAVTKYREVGIDIEYVNHDFDVLSVAASAFSAEEAERLRILPATLQTAAFFSGWTRKEACLKAMGDGLSSSAEQQAACSAIGDEQWVSFRSSAGDRITDWTLTSVETADEYKAALAVEGTIETVRYWRLEGAEA